MPSEHNNAVEPGPAGVKIMRIGLAAYRCSRISGWSGKSSPSGQPGHGIAGDDTAQLYARFALFLLVQGQTADVRAAQLALLAR